jgi:chromosome segregation ATPase
MLGWNPTETIQVEGRAWRQGNDQGIVHIVYPLMADSIDSLMYQKYDEKSSRINEVWSFKGDTSRDISDVDPETLKFDLIKDPKKKANLIVGQKKDKIKSERRIEEARYEVLFKDQHNLETAEEELPELKRDMDTAEADMLNKRKKRDTAQKALDVMKKDRGSPAHVKDAEDALNEAKWKLDQATSEFRRERKMWKEVQDDVDAYQAKFKKLGIKAGKAEDKLKEIAASIQKMKDEEEAITESYKYELEKAKKELQAASQKMPPLEEMISLNVNNIMGDLKPMKQVKAEMAARKQGLKKSFVIINGRFYIKLV